MKAQAEEVTAVVAGDFGRDLRSLKENWLLGGPAPLQRAWGGTMKGPESAQCLLLPCSTVPVQTQYGLISGPEAFPKGI